MAYIVCFHLYEITSVVKFIEMENRIAIARTSGEERPRSYYFICTEFQFEKMKSSRDGWC